MSAPNMNLDLHISSYYRQREFTSLPLNLTVRFDYKIRHVHNPLTPPYFSRAIDRQLMAQNQPPSVLVTSLLESINQWNPHLNHTSRLDLAQRIAHYLKSETLRNSLPVHRVSAAVEIFEQRGRDGAHSGIHHHQQQQAMIDGNVLIMNGSNVVGEYRRRHSGGSGTGSGVSRSTMNKLMKEGRFYYHNRGGEVEDQCSICWESYREGIEAIKMTCLHIFHQKCIVRWLKTKNSCPLCRQTM